MIRVGYFTDPHCRADTPQGRNDDYRIAIMGKLEECGSIWHEYHVQVVCCGGDIFHTPDPAHSVIYDVMSIFRSWGLPIISTVGSHEYFGYQMKTLKRTALGLVDVGSLIQLVGGDTEDSNRKLLCPKSIAYVDDQAQTRIEVTGTPHTYWLAENPKNFYMERIDPKAFQIQLVHGDLNDKPVPWQHVLVKDVKTESNLVLSGHYHPGWLAPIRIGKTTFVNPGSIGRLENTGAQRVPRVCIIDVWPDGKFDLQYVVLKTAAIHPFKDKIEVIEGDPMKDVATLLRLIGDTTVDAVDLKAQLPPAARELGFSEQVIEKAFEVLESAGAGIDN